MATGDKLIKLDSLKAVYDHLVETDGEIKSAIGIVDGMRTLSFEPGGMYQDTGINYASLDRCRTAFIPITPNSDYKIYFSISGVEILTVFEFASNTVTQESVNERLSVYSVSNGKKITLSNQTNYIRVQANIAVSSLTEPVCLITGGYCMDIDKRAMQYIASSLVPANLYDMPTDKYSVMSGTTIKAKDSFFNGILSDTISYYVYCWKFGSGSRKRIDVYNPQKTVYYSGITSNTAPITISWENLATATNRNAKMISFGNSIMTGSVWINGTGAGLVSYDNAPYGQVATALGIQRQNVNHTLISSTGLVYDTGSGSFLSNIKDTDLTGYDYLLTHLFTSDLTATGYTLGTVDDAAEDSTLAGAVVDLVTYMRTSNGMCQLILVGPPPVSYQYSGQTVFTALYGHGFSIHDVDVLMHQMAVKYRFVYIDWENMALSYYYQNYTDGDNVHANNPDTYRVMGEYLASCIRYEAEPRLLESVINDVRQYNSYDLIPYFASYVSVTSYSVRFEWNAAHTVLDVNGTNTSDSYPAVCYLYSNETAMPPGVLPGKKYYVKYATTSGFAAMRIVQYLNGGSSISTAYDKDAILNVSPDCVGMRIYVYVNAGKTVNHAQVSVQLLNAKTNNELNANIEDIEASQDNIRNSTAYDIVRQHGTFADRTLYGVTWTWNADHSVVTANASEASTGQSYVNIFNIVTFPADSYFKPGESYYFDISCADPVNISTRIFYYYNGTSDDLHPVILSSSGWVTIPTDATGIIIRPRAAANETYDNITYSLKIYPAYTNKVLSNVVKQIENRFVYGNDLITMYGERKDVTDAGITFDWTNKKCHVSGTASARAYCALINSPKKLPDGVSAGDKLYLAYESTSNKIGYEVIFYGVDGSTAITTIRDSGKDMHITVPASAYGWTVKIYVNSGNTMNDDLTTFEIVEFAPKNMSTPLIVSIIDDDASTNDYVTKFHDSCCHNGVKGNYAVITYNLEDHGGGASTSQDKMLGYQDEGFGMCIHCYQQAGAPEWNATPRDDATTTACRANLIKGMQQMQQMGFVNYNYWITPGGHKEPDLIEMSKDVGNKCLVSTNNGTHNTMRDFDKYLIKRISLRHDDAGTVAASIPADFEAVMSEFGDLPVDYDASTYQFRPNSMDGVKYYANKCVLDGGGWLIITTHYNDGWGRDPSDASITWDDTIGADGYPIGYPRFNTMAQMILGKGFVPMSIPRAWQYYAPILEANRQELNIANAN